MVAGLFPTQHPNILANTASACSSAVTTCANSALASPGNGEALRLNDKIEVFHKYLFHKLYKFSFHAGGEQLWVSRSNACSSSPEQSCAYQSRWAENFSLQGLKQISLTTQQPQKQRWCWAPLVWSCCLRGSFPWASFLSFVFVGNFQQQPLKELHCAGDRGLYKGSVHLGSFPNTLSKPKAHYIPGY